MNWCDIRNETAWQGRRKGQSDKKSMFRLQRIIRNRIGKRVNFRGQLDTNSPSILPRLSNNQPHSPRSYATFSDFHSKKVKKVCDINLTYVRYGALRVASSLPTWGEIVCWGRIEWVFGEISTLFCDVWCRVKCLLRVY